MISGTFIPCIFSALIISWVKMTTTCTCTHKNIKVSLPDVGKTNQSNDKFHPKSNNNIVDKESQIYIIMLISAGTKPVQMKQK
jgi:hypothetical protein